jgi:Transposase DDE domain group 1
MRAHAHVEDHIRRLKDSGLCRFPFVDLDANRARLAIVAFAADLVRWFQLDCLDGPLAVAEPKTLRWQLWHTPARIVRRARRQIVRTLDDWPSAEILTRAYQRIALIT